MELFPGTQASPAFAAGMVADDRGTSLGTNLMAKVLLIEDDREMAEEIRAELGHHGFEVDWAGNGIEGLDKARAGGAEVMVVDRMLPGMDGLAIIEALRHEGGRNVGGSGTPIMAYHGEGPQAQRIGELDHIQADGRKLARAHGPVRAEPRRPAAAKIGRDRAPARARQRRANAVPGSHVVGPAVQQQDRGPIRRAAAFKGDIQDGCGGVGEIVHQLLPGTRTWDVRRGIPVDPRTLSCSRC